MEKMNQAECTDFDPQKVPYVVLKAAKDYIDSRNLQPQPKIEPDEAVTNPVNKSGNGGPEPGTGNMFSEMMKAMEPFWAGTMPAAEAVNGGGPDPGDLRTMAKKITKGWYDYYEMGCSRFLNIPQLGLTRYYQERASHAVEKFNCLQIALTQYVCLLSEPVAWSIQFPQVDENPARKNGNGSDPRVRYQLWIQKLESAYLELLKSQEYRTAMSNVLKAFSDFKASRNLVIIDMLHDLPIPTDKDMDELQKELYMLKKRVKGLEKRGNTNG